MDSNEELSPAPGSGGACSPSSLPLGSGLVPLVPLFSLSLDPLLLPEMEGLLPSLSLSSPDCLADSPALCEQQYARRERECMQGQVVNCVLRGLALVC